ncbi:TCR/Tet family MFS transporter [Deinococcus sp.]|uniref:TCR/Tet family MFS transporter n=1 Tax=Deinococcus sp. TaxID=47478 RepID=UPI003CC574B3
MAARPLRTPAMGFIFVTLLIDSMGAGLIIPVFPKLVARLADSTQIGALYVGVFLGVYALAQFVCAPLLGALSDRYGRRPVLLLSLLGIGLDYLLQYFAPTLAWFFLGRVLAGVTGANITAANAYIADVSPPEKRATNFGRVGAALGMGFIVGPALGGVLGGVDLRLPFLFAASLAFLNFLYGLLILPESLPKEQRNGVPLYRINPLASLSRLSHFPLVRSLTFSFVLISLAQQFFFSTWVLFTQVALSWTPARIGVGVAVSGVVTALVQGSLVGYGVRLFGEHRSVVVGLSLSVLTYVAFGLVRTDWQIYVVIVLGSLDRIAGPSIQSLISQAVNEREQGAVQGSLSSLASLTGVVGPPFATWIFAVFTAKNSPIMVPGIAFFAGAGLILVAVVTSASVLKAYGAAAKTSK